MGVNSCTISAEEVIRTLETEKTLTLATCAGSRVTIRPMSHINDGLTVFFQTGSDSLKIRQIKENPYVALCVGTYQIEGVAIGIGHPLAVENEFFATAYKEKHPGSYERYSALEDEIVVKVTIHRVKQWRYVNGKPLLVENNFTEGE